MAHRGLVEGPPAVLRAAEARDLDVLNGELVVICDLLIDIDVLLRVDDNLFLRLHCDHLGVAVGLRERWQGGEPVTEASPGPSSSAPQTLPSRT